MYLKDLTLRGFKSFASATKFRFEPGITAVVGPNGSGKSNVVDALAWVMGEQGAKSLRGGNMADVIFAGSAQRPALGRAQVELTIDNSDGKLPIGYSEVTISRTMFRSGGSEYAINHQPVRLLDVQELLSDSGLGRQMHVIVGQGQLDAVLTATPQDRRAFIDEAAGVAKHRRRKERALRKLEAMDGNLVRVLDLTEEIRRQLRPLARQAKAAREAAGVRERLDYARARLLAADLVEADGRLMREKRELDALRNTSGDMERQIRQLQQQFDTDAAQVEKLARQAQDIQEQYRDFRELAHRLNSIAELAGERAASAKRVPSAITDEAVQLSVKRAEEAEQEAATAAQAASQAAVAATAEEATRREQQSKAEQAKAELAALQKQLEQAQQRFREHERRIERASAAVRSGEEQVQAARQAHAAAEERLSALPVPEEPEDQGAVDADTFTTQYEQAAEAESQARQAVDEAARAERAAAEELSRQLSRRETLAASLRQAVPSSKGQGAKVQSAERWVESVLRASPGGALSGLISVQRGWEDAVTALLGSLADARVLSSEGLLSELLEHEPGAQSQITGMVTPTATGEPQPGAQSQVSGMVVPTATGEPESGESEAGAQSTGSSPDGAIPALSAVTAPPELRGALTDLLAGCWLCADSESALALFQQDRVDGAFPARLAVTPDGKIFTAHSVRLPGQTGPSSLRLRAELEAASKDADHAGAALETAAARTRDARSALATVAARRETALEQLRQNDARAAEEAGKRARAAALRHAAAQDLSRAQDRVQAAERAHAEAQAALQALGDGTAEAAQAPPSADEFLAGARERLAHCESALEQARETDSAARMAAHVAQERRTSMERQAQAFRAQAQRLRDDRERQLERESRALQVTDRAYGIASRAKEGAREAEQGAARLEQARSELAQQRTLADAAAERARSELSGLEAARGGAHERLLQAEVAFAQFQGARANVLAQVMDFCGEPAEDEGAAADGAGPLPDSASVFIQKYGPQNPWNSEQGSEEEVPFDRGLAAEQLRRAERELQRLGVVNPLAVEEHAALQARLDFLLEQVEDLNRSKADLLELIREVDAQVKSSFNSAFADVSEQFTRVFERLFPGGKGRLELTDPEDPLATGVEIYARPSGKKVTRLSLLSGGERSLAALAYLIAIFLARPSPFYVMDEVEAALDDVNLSRVLSLFEDLRHESQLLVITHQKRTMEIADALYGVSMKGGVTAVVSHRMEQ